MSRTGPRGPRLSPGASVEDRLMFRRSIDDKGCWVWTGCLKDTGYGCMQVDKKLRFTHRLSYETFVGPIPDGLQLDHLCRNRACFNPDHLEPVTTKVNTLRGMSVGAIARRRDDCLYGHPYSGWGMEYDGRRSCRLCRLAYLRVLRSTKDRVIQKRRLKGDSLVDLAKVFASEDHLRLLRLLDDDGNLAALPLTIEDKRRFKKLRYSRPTEAAA